MDVRAAEPPPARRKGDKRERTRARLIEAASLEIRDKGFENTTVADIAQRAGMTTGAIYGNFRNREDLFMAVANKRGAPIIPRLTPGMTFPDQMRALAEAVIAALPQRRAAVQGALAFHRHTLNHEDVRAQVLARTARIYQLAADAMAAMNAPETLPMPPATLARVLHALTDGLVLQRILTPELISDDVIYAAFAAIAGQRTEA